MMWQVFWRSLLLLNLALIVSGANEQNEKSRPERQTEFHRLFLDRQQTQSDTNPILEFDPEIESSLKSQLDLEQINAIKEELARILLEQKDIRPNGDIQSNQDIRQHSPNSQTRRSSNNFNQNSGTNRPLFPNLGHSHQFGSDQDHFQKENNAQTNRPFLSNLGQRNQLRPDQAQFQKELDAQIENLRSLKAKQDEIHHISIQRQLNNLEEVLINQRNQQELLKQLLVQQRNVPNGFSTSLNRFLPSSNVLSSLPNGFSTSSSGFSPSSSGFSPSSITLLNTPATGVSTGVSLNPQQNQPNSFLSSFGGTNNHGLGNIQLSTPSNPLFASPSSTTQTLRNDLLQLQYLQEQIKLQRQLLELKRLVKEAEEVSNIAKQSIFSPSSANTNFSPSPSRFSQSISLTDGLFTEEDQAAIAKIISSSMKNTGRGISTRNEKETFKNELAPFVRELMKEFLADLQEKPKVIIEKVPVIVEVMDKNDKTLQPNSKNLQFSIKTDTSTANDEKGLEVEITKPAQLKLVSHANAQAQVSESRITDIPMTTMPSTTIPIPITIRKNIKSQRPHQVQIEDTVVESHTTESPLKVSHLQPVSKGKALFNDDTKNMLENKTLDLAKTTEALNSITGEDMSTHLKEMISDAVVEFMKNSDIDFLPIPAALSVFVAAGPPKNSKNPIPETTTEHIINEIINKTDDIIIEDKFMNISGVLLNLKETNETTLNETENLVFVPDQSVAKISEENFIIDSILKAENISVEENFIVETKTISPLLMEEELKINQSEMIIGNLINNTINELSDQIIISEMKKINNTLEEGTFFDETIDENITESINNKGFNLIEFMLGTNPLIDFNNTVVHFEDKNENNTDLVDGILDENVGKSIDAQHEVNQIITKENTEPSESDLPLFIDGLRILNIETSTSISKITDENIANIFDLAFENFASNDSEAQSVLNSSTTENTSFTPNIDAILTEIQPKQQPQFQIILDENNNLIMVPLVDIEHSTQPNTKSMVMDELKEDFIPKSESLIEDPKLVVSITKSVSVSNGSEKTDALESELMAEATEESVVSMRDNDTFAIDTNIDAIIGANIDSNINTNIDTIFNTNFDTMIDSNIDANIEKNINANFDEKFYTNVDTHMNSNVDSNTNANMAKNINANIDSVTDANVNANIDANIDTNIKANIDSNTDANVDANIDTRIDKNIDANHDANIDTNTLSNKASIKLEPINQHIEIQNGILENKENTSENNNKLNDMKKDKQNVDPLLLQKLQQLLFNPPKKTSKETESPNVENNIVKPETDQEIKQLDLIHEKDDQFFRTSVPLQGEGDLQQGKESIAKNLFQPPGGEDAKRQAEVQESMRSEKTNKPINTINKENNFKPTKLSLNEMLVEHDSNLNILDERNHGNDLIEEVVFSDHIIRQPVIPSPRRISVHRDNIINSFIRSKQPSLNHTRMLNSIKPRPLNPIQVNEAILTNKQLRNPQSNSLVNTINSDAINLSNTTIENSTNTSNSSFFQPILVIANSKKDLSLLSMIISNFNNIGGILLNAPNTTTNNTNINIANPTLINNAETNTETILTANDPTTNTEIIPTTTLIEDSVKTQNNSNSSSQIQNSEMKMSSVSKPNINELGTMMEAKQIRVKSIVSPSGSLTFLPIEEANNATSLGVGIPLPNPQLPPWPKDAMKII